MDLFTFVYMRILFHVYIQIGIFTKMDIFSNEYEDSDESKQELFLSYMDPKNAGMLVIIMSCIKFLNNFS